MIEELETSRSRRDAGQQDHHRHRHEALDVVVVRVDPSTRAILVAFNNKGPRRADLEAAESSSTPATAMTASGSTIQRRHPPHHHPPARATTK
jgi:hypothetical protein